LLYQKDFDEVVFETPLNKIRAIGVRSETSFARKNRNIIYLYLPEKKVIRLNVLDTQQFKQKLEHLIEKTGITLDDELTSELLDEKTHNFLMDGEKIFCKDKLWHRVQESGIIGETWKPGCLYLTNKRLCWWYDFEGKIVFQIPIEEICSAVKERRDLSTVLKDIVKGSQAEEEEKETCPQCGSSAPVNELLEKGCSKCGWVSPKQKEKLKIKN
jgi:hypothetical protein